MTDPFAATCPFCSAALPDDDPAGERHTCEPEQVSRNVSDDITGHLDAALAYAAAGNYVFPARVEIVDGKKKVTPVASWRQASTTSTDTIRRWWTPGSPWHRASVAIDCGRSGVVVVDPDGAAGIAKWAALVAEHSIAATWRASTPGGGEHHYYREHPRRVVGIDSSGKVASHVDVRGLGGFVIAPPSTDARGGYRWLEGEPDWAALPVVPDLVIERMNRKEEKEQPAASPSGERRFTRAQAAKFVQPHLDALRAARDGTINHRLNDAAVAFGHFVPRFWTTAQVHAILLDALANTVYDGRTWKAENTIRSGLGSAGWVAELVEDGPGVPNGTADQHSSTPDVPDGTPVLDDEFWNARAFLKHIRDAAWSRQRSAAGVLGVVLARVAACVPHQLRLPATVGSTSGLSFISLVIAPPGIGKSSANGIGAEILLAPDGLDIKDQVPPGTGEGFAELYFGLVDDEEDEGAPGKNRRKVKRQVRHNCYFFIDEGQILTEIGTRKNAVLLPTIRSAFSGATLGQSNASEEKTRVLPAGSYTMGMSVAIQDNKAGDILDDADGGTPQRMLWCSAWALDLPPRESLPPWPGPLPWSPPTQEALRKLRERQGDKWVIGGPVYMDVAESVNDEIGAADWDRVMRRTTLDPLDAHEGLLRLKLAALLAILDGRLNVSEDDWALATQIKRASDVTRDGVVEAVKADAVKREREASTRQARRAVHADAAVTENLLENARRWIRKKVCASPGHWTARDLRGGAGLRRPVFNDALEEEIAAGRIEVRAEDGQGTPRKVLWPG